MAKPEHLTFKEFHDVINHKNESHDESAYQRTSLDHYTKDEREKTHVNLIEKFTQNGINFELREGIRDRWEDDYVKYDENDEIARDENGLALYISMEEKKERLNPRFEYEHAIYDVTNNCLVSWTQDEWRCLLIQTAKEYRGLGLATKLLSHHFSVYPERPSGGMTPGGMLAVRKTHQSMVMSHLENGGYEDDIKNGLLSREKVDEILISAHATKDIREKLKADLKADGSSDSYINHVILRPKDTSKDHIDLSMNNPDNWLLHTGSNWAVLYDKGIYDLLENDNQEKFEHFLDKAIVGYCYIGGVYGNDSTPKLFRLHGNNDKIKAFMSEVAMNISLGSPVRIFKADMPLIGNHLSDKSNITPVSRSTMHECVMTEPSIDNLSKMSFREKVIRGQFDQYDEKWTQIQEMAYAIAESKYTSDLDNDSENTY